MKVLLLCDEGHSTSILMTRVREAAKALGAEVSVACGGFTGRFFETDDADVVLVAPQVGFLIKDLEAHLKKPIALGLIPRRVFGALDAHAIVALARDLYDAYAPYRIAWQRCKELAPKEVLVCCAGGMSSSLLVWYMERAAKAAHLHVHIAASGVTRAQFLMDTADCVLIAPQVSMAEDVLQQFNDRHIPVGHIPPKRYGCMDGSWIMGEAQELLQKGGTPPHVVSGEFQASWEQAVATLKKEQSKAQAQRDVIVKAYGRRKQKNTQAVLMTL